MLARYGASARAQRTYDRTMTDNHNPPTPRTHRHHLGRSPARPHAQVTAWLGMACQALRSVARPEGMFCTESLWLCGCPVGRTLSYDWSAVPGVPPPAHRIPPAGFSDHRTHHRISELPIRVADMSATVAGLSSNGGPVT